MSYLASQELLQLVFFLHEILRKLPCPIVKASTVWRLQSACTEYAASIDHISDLALSTSRIKGRFVVWSRYSITILNFFQSSALGFQTLVVRKCTDGAKSGLDLLLICNSWATNLCYIFAFSGSRFLDSSLTSNNLGVFGDALVEFFSLPGISLFTLFIWLCAVMINI